MGQGRARGRWAKHRASHQVVVLNLSWAWSPLLQPTAVPRDLFSPGQSHSGDLLASAPISQARACQGSACARHIVGAPWFPGEGRRGRSPELQGLCQLAWPGPSPGTLLDSQECWKQSRSPSLQTRRPHVAPTARSLSSQPDVALRGRRPPRPPRAWRVSHPSTARQPTALVLVTVASHRVGQRDPCRRLRC